MKNYIYSLLLLILPSLLMANSDTTSVVISDQKPEVQHKKSTQLITHILAKNHYKQMELNDSLSSEIFDGYISGLDYNRIHFLQSDIKEFEQFRYKFDDYFQAGYLDPAYTIFNIYQKRFTDRLDYIDQQIDTGFDYSLKEYLEIDRSEANWARDYKELKELWRLRLKYEALNLKLNGKDDEGIRDILHKRYQNLRKRMSQYQSEDVYQIVMNALAESYDPHTNYFSPKNFDNFKIQMSQSFEGIGARLSTRNDHTVVVEIIPGGPADRSKALHPNDKITAVSQGESGEFVDVVGWRIDDVVQLIRGKKNTTVRLELIRAESPEYAQRDTLALLRDKVNIEEQTAKSEVIQLEHEGKTLHIGIIDIPTFYSDFDGRQDGSKDYNSTSRDVKRLIQEMDPQKIDGLIIDLRRNGGGFLNEAIELTGLFIDKGPVVQVKNTNGRVEVEWDNDSGMVYDGPLAVLVDRISASASEIFAAAIQDYKRGIIVGAQTFGKGTVQNAIDLNRFLRSETRLGQIKMTVAKFYRINGGSTQHLGVIPDISIPSRYSSSEIGESASPNALVWDQIRPAKYAYSGDVDSYIPKLNLLHLARIKDDPDYIKFLDDINKYQKNHDRKEVSLNEAERRKEREQDKIGAEEEEFDEEAISSENPEEKKKDLMLTETSNILGDYILISKQTRTGQK